MKAKDYFINFVKGVFIGISNIIPGISASALAISFGIYETIIDSINNFFKNKKRNFYILFSIVIGIIIGIISSSKIVTFLLDNYYVQTVMFFIGLIIGGIKIFSRKVTGKATKDNIFIFLLVFIIMVLFNLFIKGTSSINVNDLSLFGIIKLFLVGFVSMSVMMVPGLSGAFVLIHTGYYEGILNIISDLLKFSSLKPLYTLIPFVIGGVIGIILITRLIFILMKKFKDKTSFAILGFIASSIIVLLLQIHNVKISLLSIISYIIFLSWGYLLTASIEKE